MNNVLKSFVKGFSYSFTTNVLSLLIKTSYILILPKLIGVEDFAYWQLYFLYASFIHIFHFGLVDGVYLKIGGLFFDELDKKKLRPQFFILFFMAVAFASILCFYAETFVENNSKRYLLQLISIDMLLTLPRTLLSIVFQATGMIRQYSLALFSESIIVFCLTAVMIFCDIGDFKILVLSDCLARIFSLFLSYQFAPGLIKFVKIKIQDIRESLDNIKIGSNILIANLSANITLSVIRLLIENVYGVVVFSKVSIAFSIANIVLIGVSAASVVLFPILKRLKEEQLANFYFSLKTLLFSFLIILSVLYYPLQKVLMMWLPAYHESFYYLSIVAPICLYEAQIMLVNNNFLKAYRKENTILNINIIAFLLVMFGLGFVVTLKLPIEYILLWFLSIGFIKLLLVDRAVEKIIGSKGFKVFICQVATMSVFVVSNHYIGESVGTIAYIAFVIGTIAFNVGEIREAYIKFKNIESKLKIKSPPLRSRGD